MSSYLAKKELHALPLAFIAISTILGSGWLLAPAFAFSEAGTYSLYSWVIGYAMVLIIALCFAETCSMIPRDGSTVILPRLTHGYLVSSIFGFLGWLSWLALIPIEVQASIQYLSHFYPSLIFKNGHLTVSGHITSVALMLSITIINFFSIKWVSWLNKYVFIALKLGVPLLIVIYGLYISHFKEVNTIVHTHSINGLFKAIPLGIVFSFNGFKAVCEKAGRARKPSFAIPFCIIFSLTICLALYLLLQVAYNVNATNGVLKNALSPFVAMIYSTKTPLMDLMIFILYVGAVTSPYAANIFNLSSCDSCVYRMAKFNYIPSFLKNKNRFKRYYIALLVNFMAALALLLLNQGWGQMVNNLTSIMVVTYAIAPVALFALRYQHPEFKRSFKLPFGKFVSLIAFILANFMIYWCGWEAIKYFLFAVLIGLMIIFICAFSRPQKISFDLRNSIWIWFWFIGIGLISYFGSYGGGKHYLSGIWALIIITLFSALVLYSSFGCKLSGQQSTKILDLLDS